MRFMLSICILCLGCSGIARAEPPGFTNPILPGGYPDPSICRDGEDFYLVNSTFEYFPGLPIHHSRDLVNWTLVGYGLHRAEQVQGRNNLVDVQSDGGIHAPSIRCRDGKFFIITTNVYVPPEPGAQVQFINFIITADDVRGPWSQPLILDGAPGIDPDIFFDDDGKVWYVGTHSPDEPDFPGQGEIWLQQIDTDNWRLTGPRHLLWRGACGGVWVEGPHIYRHDGRYYLLVAEGGTSFNHAVMIAVSDRITGPYVGNDRNPILSSRHLSYDNWVNSTGHADLVQLEDGRWYMTALGIRGDEQRRSNMGRETHLLPVIWEREPFDWKDPRYSWPVVSPATGRLERTYPVPFAGTRQQRELGFVDDFDGENLKLQWNFRRLPLPETYELRGGRLRLAAGPEQIRERGRASLMGFRQTESDFNYQASMYFVPSVDGVYAGINLFQKDDNYLSALVVRKAGKYWLELTLVRPDSAPEILSARNLDSYDGQIVFQLDSGSGRYEFSYSLDQGQRFIELHTTAASHVLSNGYTGAYLGIYATGAGQSTEDHAEFDWVRYQGLER
jgi:alpha-N-arabinofuranosidase